MESNLFDEAIESNPYEEAVEEEFQSLDEVFAGLREAELEAHGIYMDYSPDDEFIASMDKCKDSFLNVLLDRESLRYSSMFCVNVHEGDSENDTGEDINVKFRVHDPTTEWKLMKPVVGDMFESHAQLKFCIINYGVADGYELHFEKNDGKRLIARCGKRKTENSCPWRLHASWMNKERSFQVKRLTDTHNCSRNFKFGSLVTPEWIRRHFVNEIASKPNIKLREMVTEVKRKFNAAVSTGQCDRAKRWVKQLIEGKLTEHYARIWDYGHEVLRSSPGSTCKVCVNVNPDGKTYFHRFYVCFKGVSDGWKRSCRHVIGLDGCFLKGEVKGELLTAIGRDANNQVYPIAWAVVNIENKANWTWFIDLLSDDLSLEGGRGPVVLSDQHKGLVESVKDLLPCAEHRQCARHIYANFRKAYSGLEFKKRFWAAAMSTVEEDFKTNMQRIRRLSESAYEYLLSKNPRSWCRAYLGTGFACEAVENGISECFNAIIVDARWKPLITMLEEIRIYVMDRMSHMAEKTTKWKSNVCPAILKKMWLYATGMRHWVVIISGGSVFEARDGFRSYKVDLDGRSCSCRLWDLSGIPCLHATAAINYIHKSPQTYVSEWFLKQRFLECYLTNIQPMNGSNLWSVTDTPSLCHL